MADFLREFGIPVIDTDDIARQVVAPGHPAWHRLGAAFGPAYFHPDGHLDRAAMARLVFANPDARRQLEAITHPAIFAEVDRRIADLQAMTPPPPLIVVVVPLLYEVGAAGRFDLTVVVYATPEQQRARLQHDRGYTAEEAEARLAAQMPLADKLPLADYVIDNSGTPAQTRTHVRAFLDALGIPTDNAPRV